MRISYFKHNEINAFLKRLILVVFVFFGTLESYSQLSDLHYLPPLKQANSTAAFTTQKIYVSTPVTTAFTVNVYKGTSATLFATFSVSNASPYTYTLASGGDNDITLLTDANCGSVQSNSGLRFESPGGQKFYVNWRGKSTSQASSLTSKGRAALGTAFKWGGIPNKGINATLLNSCLGIMATENNTNITVFGYDTGCTFRLGSNASGITSDVITISLNKGQTYVLEAIVNGASTAPNREGWLGASITSDKNIAVSFGELLFQPDALEGQDAGMDQIIPENTLGRQYVFVRGNGPDAQEFPVIVATQNSTKIYVNGGATAIATINNGDYFAIPSTYFSASGGGNAGANMLVTTSKEVYAFQSVSGANNTSNNTQDINFIAPVNCLLSNTVNNIPSITDMAGTTITGGVTIIASTAIPNASITVKQGANTVSTSTISAAQKAVAGTTEWKTFYLSNLTGNVSVSATGPIAVGFFGYSGAAGASGYFSGFETIPTIQVQYLVGDGCLPSTVLSATAGFTSYAWYNSGVLVPGITSNTYTPDAAGNYTVKVTQGSCVYESATQSVYDCNPEIIVRTVADKNNLISGETVTFSVFVKYLGENNVTNLSINNAIPSNLTVTSAIATYGTVTGTGSNRAWNIGTMYNGEEHILTVVATANAVTSPTTETFTVTKTQTLVGTESNKVADDFSENVTISQSCTSSLAGTISGNRSVCSGTNSTVLTVSGYYADSLQWQVSSDNSTFTDITNQTAATYTAVNLSATTYYRVKVIYGSCTVYSTSVAMNIYSLPTPTFTAQPGATACRNSDVTYTSQSGQSNYVWTIPGTLGTDYSITSGGTGADNSVVLKWLTTGSKTVTINYSNSNSCTAVLATSSTITTVSPTSVAGTISGAGAICSGGTKVLTLSGNTGTVTKWQSSSSSDFSTAPTDISNTTTSLTTSALSSTTYFRAIVTSGSCSPANSSGVVVTVTPDNSMTLSSAAGTDSQTVNVNSSITNITYSTTGATGATFSGLPTSVSGSYNSGTVTISGSPSGSGASNYTVTLTGGCGAISAAGTITIRNNPTLSNFNSQSKYFHDRSYTLIPPTSDSPGTFSYTSSNTAVATITGRTVTFVGPGTTTITATQAPGGGFQSASIDATLTIIGVTIATRSGAISSTNLNYINRTGGLSRKKGLTRKGQIVTASTSPEINPTTISNITTVSATATGTIVTEGGFSITARGFCWATTTNPTIENSISTETGTTGNLTSNLSGLTSGTTYYIRTYATNSSGTAYGNEVSFTTL